MLQSIYFKNKIKSLSIFDVIKIIIIVLFSFAVLGNISPYYIGIDPAYYASTAINLSSGSYGLTNELLIESDGNEFVPRFFAKTIHDTIIPFPTAGFTALTTFSYLIAGYYGLLYQGPILAILFIIVSERVATKIIGSFVGLVTLALLATNFVILKHSTMLMTDPIFSIFLIVGCFFLIKFFREGKTSLILLSSIFLAGSAFLRYNGMILFPIEVFLILTYLFYKFYQNKKQSKKTNQLILITDSKVKIIPFKITFFVLIPWIVFFLFWFSFNEYFFGEPFTNFYEESPDISALRAIRIAETNRPDLIPSLLTFDSYRFEWINFHASVILPEPLKLFLQNSILFSASDSNNNMIQGGFTFLILFVGLGISLKMKQKRKEILVLLTIIFGFLLFFSSYYITWIDLTERYLFPVYALSFMIFGFVVHRIWGISFGRIFIKHPKKYLIIFKLSLLFILILIAVIELLENKKIKDLLESGFNFSNPSELLKRYPLEKLPEKSIVVDYLGYRTLEYNAIQFNPIVGGFSRTDGAYLEYNAFKENWIVDGVPDFETMELIERQKKLLSQGYNIFSLKDQIYDTEILYFKYLEEHHGLFLKDYSETFCKLVQKEQLEDNSKSDQVCLSFDKVRYFSSTL